MVVAWTILLGLVVGSFLNVVVHRVPAGLALPELREGHLAQGQRAPGLLRAAKCA